MSRRWLVTGAQGLLGTYAAAHILRTDSESVVVGVGRGPRLQGCFSHFLTGRGGPVRAPLPANLSSTFDSRFVYIRANVCDPDALTRIMRATRPTAVLHFASGLRGDDAQQLMKVNAEGSAAVVAACSTLSDRPVCVLASSGGVYGGLLDDEHPASETRPCCPADPYATAKLRAEEAAYHVAEASGVRLVVLRIFNVIGAGQDERHIGGRLALQVTQAAENGGRPITVGRLDPVRDFVAAEDVAAAAVCLALESTVSGVFNCASGRPVSIGDLCRTFLEAAGLDSEIASDDHAEPGVLRNCGDPRRLSEFGWTPRISLLQSAKSCLDYYQRLWS